MEEIRKDLLLSSDIHHILYGFNAARPMPQLDVYIGMSERNHYVAHVSADNSPE